VRVYLDPSPLVLQTLLDLIQALADRLPDHWDCCLVVVSTERLVIPI